jgi:hypothetical protein
MHKNRSGFIRVSVVGAGQDATKRGVELQEAIAGAQEFADQAAIDTYVSGRGGLANTYVAVTLP